MEHLSRRTSGRVDMLLLVTDYSLRGLRAVQRINDMLGDLNLDVLNTGIVVTRAPAVLDPAFLAKVEEIGVPLVGRLPDDPQLMEFDLEQKSLMELEKGALSADAVDGMMDVLMPM